MAVRFQVGNSLELIADIDGDWSGQPVLLLHGGGQTRHAWGSTRSALADAGFLVINLDLRGHGESGWAPDGDYSIDAYAQDLRSVVNLIGRPVALVGASLGGLLSLIAAGEEPRVSCSALILVDVAPQDRNGRTGSHHRIHVQLVPTASPRSTKRPILLRSICLTARVRLIPAVWRRICGWVRTAGIIGTGILRLWRAGLATSPTIPSGSSGQRSPSTRP